MKKLFFLLLLVAFSAADAATPAVRVLIVVGPTDHPPGTHEVAAGGRLMKHCLETMANVPGVKADVVYEWPEQALRNAAATVVFIGDTFPANRLPNAGQNLADLDAMMRRGCGIACVHYATGLLGKDVTPEGDHPLLRWLGGYFANRSCKHHESFAKIFPAATITPAAPQHPVARGWREFTVNDEPYTNNYFGPGNQLAPNVTVLATSMLPPDAPKAETVAWGVERADGGRGFGIVMPHFYKNWRDDDLRRFILNGIVWTAKLEVPADGVQTPPPDLATFAPESIEPKPWPPKPSAALALAQKIVASHGGAEKLLRVFKFSETFHLRGNLEKGTDRTSILQPPHLWYVGKKERVAQENKGGACHDVWMWTLGPLVDPKTRLETLPDATIDDKAARGLQVSGTIEPPMNVFFDAATDDLLKIEWKGEQFLFSEPIAVDGTRVPSKTVLIGKTGNERMRTTLRSVERLAALPADLPQPDEAPVAK